MKTAAMAGLAGMALGALLAACDGSSRTLHLDYSSEHGQTLRSTVVRHGEVTTFQCQRSRSGQCHYQVYVQACGNGAATSVDAAADCPRTLIESFAVAEGAKLQRPGLPAEARNCVSEQAEETCG